MSIKQQVSSVWAWVPGGGRQGTRPCPARVPLVHRHHPDSVVCPCSGRLSTKGRHAEGRMRLLTVVGFRGERKLLESKQGLHWEMKKAPGSWDSSVSAWCACKQGLLCLAS